MFAEGSFALNASKENVAGKTKQELRRWSALGQQLCSEPGTGCDGRQGRDRCTVRCVQGSAPVPAPSSWATPKGWTPRSHTDPTMSSMTQTKSLKSFNLEAKSGAKRSVQRMKPRDLISG